MKTIFLAFLITFSLTSYSQNQLHPTNLQKIEKLLNEYPIKNSPGMAISVSKAGKIIYKKNKGYANLEHKIAITDSTKFAVGSISKQFAAFSILLLESEEKLSIDDNIKKYLPELQELPYIVTIKQLLNHTSGFRNTTDLYNLKGRKEYDLNSQDEMVALLLRQKGLNFKPGSRFQYCNSGYVLIAEIIKRVSGISFAKFTQEKIFKPLKMKHSLFLDDPNLVVQNRAFSYAKQGDNYHYIPLNHTIVGSTGLYTTVSDLSLWAANFDNPYVGNKSIFHKMRTKSRLGTGEVIPYALGQELKMYKGVAVIFHGGGDGGFRSYLIRVPDHKLTIAISGNFESFNPLNIAYGLVDVFLSDQIKETPARKIPTYKNKDLKKFEGDYQIFPGLYITLAAENDTLYFKSYGSDHGLKLPILGENEFEFPDRPHSKFKFYGDSLTWHFSDFYYPGNKVTLAPPKYDHIAVNEYQGIYRSSEVETSYKIIIKNNKLIATHNFNPDAVLEPIDKDSFITNSSYIGRIEFIRNKKGDINGCKISGQTSYDMFFSKTE